MAIYTGIYREEHQNLEGIYAKLGFVQRPSTAQSSERIP